MYTLKLEVKFKAGSDYEALKIAEDLVESIPCTFGMTLFDDTDYAFVTGGGVTHLGFEQGLEEPGQ